MSKIVNEKWKITPLENGYLMEIESGGKIRKYCCKTSEELKEFVYECLLYKVDDCEYVEVETKIKI